ncbi:hypothetical protein NSER024013_37670 [Nocardia seriolae]|nr:hypothetical protein NSER024013_37670 [Nocardia seriolae]
MVTGAETDSAAADPIGMTSPAVTAEIIMSFFIEHPVRRGEIVSEAYRQIPGVQGTKSANKRTRRDIPKAKGSASPVRPGITWSAAG